MVVQHPSANLEKMDSNLAGFNQQLAQSARVLDELATIQTQFEDLAQTYQDFKQYSEQLKAQSLGLTAQSSDLGVVTEERLEALEAHFASVQQGFSGLQQAVEDPREAVQIYIESLEGRLRQELRGALSRIDQVGFSPAQLEKVEKLDIQMRALRTALRNAERRGHRLQNWLAAVTIMAVMGLGLPLVMPLILGETEPAGFVRGASETEVEAEASRSRRGSFGFSAGDGAGDLGRDWSGFLGREKGDR